MIAFLFLKQLSWWNRSLNHQNKITGQNIDYKENRDNSPASISAPNAHFKAVLEYYAHKNCSRCGGTGYIGRFKHCDGGRCYQCIPDQRWEILLGEVHLIGHDNDTGEPVCEIRYMTEEVCTKSGFIVADVGLPHIGEFEVFDTKEAACEAARKLYNV